MSLCKTPLPPACEKEIQRLVELLPEADLAALAATEPAFKAGGFRPGNPAALRVRLQQIVCGSAVIPETLRRAIARRSRSHTLTGLLAPETLAEARHALAALLSPEVLLVALLLDPRPEVRDKAESWLQLPQPFLTLAPADALERLRGQFSDLTGLLGAAPSDGLPATRESWQQQKEKLEARIRDLQSENRRLKGVEDRLANTARLLKTSEDKLAAALAAAAETDAALRQKSRALDETAAELARETSRREERLVAALDAALAREFHGWLRQARAVEAAAADTAPHADLLAKAAAALRKQAETDRHSGNRAVLAQRLEQLETARRDVRAALRNALRQNPELKTVEAELSDQITSLSSVLDPDSPASSLEEALLTRIHAAADNDLPRLRDLPDLFASLRILDAAALARLRDAFQKRFSAIQALGVPPDPRMEERQNASSLLGRALAGQAPAILLIDAHNVLFGLPVRYMPARGTSLTDAEKRQRLVDDIVRIAAPSPTLRAWIVFDGHTRSDTQAAPNVRVTYSGGEGEHRADNVILDNIRFFTTTSPELPVILVSNDNDLCTAARRLGARDIAVLDLGAFL